ncbi:MAG: oxygen-independent coproporphyrinogen III oxidase [Desulfatitalea sp.]
MTDMQESKSLNPDLALLEKHDLYYYGMYGEYPHKSFWSYDYNDADVRTGLTHLARREPKSPTALYLHIPFCPSQCQYCVCHTVITKDYGRVQNYLNYLHTEIDLVRAHFESLGYEPEFTEIHLGGGSPSWLTEADFDALVARIGTLVDLKGVQEFTIEIDPRGVDTQRLHYYHSKGINRISFGVQDFDPDVQKAINRIQPAEMIERLLTPEVRKKFTNINFDILYGLPLQTRETFRQTISELIRLSPERTNLLLYNYTPDMKRHQTLMNRYAFPSKYDRLIMFLEGSQMLEDHGYAHIGYEHFAKPDNALTQAYRNKKAHWNTLGYTPGRYDNMIGLGSGSASGVGRFCYSQNVYPHKEYFEALEKGQFPVFRGYVLNEDDLIRLDVIQQLRSYFHCDIKDTEQRLHIDFHKYFESELKSLKPLINDGFVMRHNGDITITTDGKPLLAAICRKFDRYNKAAQN